MIADAIFSLWRKTIPGGKWILPVLILNLVLTLTPAPEISRSDSGEPVKQTQKNAANTPSVLPNERKNPNQPQSERISEKDSQAIGSDTPQPETDIDNKVALIIGNTQYNASPDIPPLANPVNDANMMAETLENMGFDVIIKLDLSKDATIDALDEFQNRISDGASVALFYYSGHGLQYEGDNYIIPVTSIIERNEHIIRYGVNFQELLQRIESADAETNILIFDACRSLTDFRKTRGLLRNKKIAGLAQISTTAPSFIAYSTSPGEAAFDGLGSNSPFTEELLKWITEPGLTIEQVFKRVRRDVMRKTDNYQRPWDLSSLVEEFYFVVPDKSARPAVDTDNFDKAYAYFNIGLEQFDNDKIDDAIKTFSKVIEISPDYSEAYKERGTSYIKKKQYNKSIDDLDKAIELNPEFTAAYNNRGIVYSILGEHKTAMENFDKAIAIDKSFIKPYNNKARLYQIQGENEKAFELYAAALEINPEYAPLYNNRGLLYYSEKQYRKAADDFTNAIRNDEEYADAYHNRGITYYYMDQFEKALKDYNGAILLDPGNFKYYRDRAHLYDEMGLQDKAESDRETAAKLSK